MKSLSMDTALKLKNLSHACSTDETRYHLNSVIVDNGEAFATDGHIAAWFKDDDLKDLSFAVDQSYFKHVKKSPLVSVTDTKFIIDGVEFPLSEKALLDRCLSAKRHVLTGYKANPKTIEPGDGETIENRLAFNPLLLTRLYKALGNSKDPKVYFVPSIDKLGPIDVYQYGERTGLLMPMRLP